MQRFTIFFPVYPFCVVFSALFLSSLFCCCCFYCLLRLLLDYVPLEMCALFCKAELGCSTTVCGAIIRPRLRKEMSEWKISGLQLAVLVCLASDVLAVPNVRPSGLLRKYSTGHHAFVSKFKTFAGCDAHSGIGCLPMQCSIAAPLTSVRPISCSTSLSGGASDRKMCGCAQSGCCMYRPRHQHKFDSI